MIQRGFRAQLRTSSLLTGQLFVALDFFPDAPKYQVDPKRSPPELPTIPGDLEDLQKSLKAISQSLAAVKFDQIGSKLGQTLEALNAVLRRFDSELGPELKTTLQELQKTLKAAEQTMASDSPMVGDVRDAAKEVTRAAHSLRALTDLLERQPEALIKGKKP